MSGSSALKSPIRTRVRFAAWPSKIEGLPYKKGNEEDLAVKRVIRRYEAARAAERRAAEGAAVGVRSGRARTAEKLVDLVPRPLGLGRRGRR